MTRSKTKSESSTGSNTVAKITPLQQSLKMIRFKRMKKTWKRSQNTQTIKLYLSQATTNMVLLLQLTQTNNGGGIIQDTHQTVYTFVEQRKQKLEDQQ